MRTATSNDIATIAACVVIGFLIAGWGMYHSILDTLFIFAGIHAGAAYGSADRAALFARPVLGNRASGIGLATAAWRPLRETHHDHHVNVL